MNWKDFAVLLIILVPAFYISQFLVDAEENKDQNKDKDKPKDEPEE